MRAIMLSGMRPLIAAIVGLLVAGIVVLHRGRRLDRRQGRSRSALFGVACVVAVSLVFLAVGRSEDAERAAGRSRRREPDAERARSRAARSAPAAGAGPAAAYAAASAQLAAVTRLMS